MIKLKDLIKIKEDIEVDTLHYRGTYGKLPKGYGSWFFKIGNEEKSFSGHYADAVSKAKDYAREKGETRIEVMT